jgi:GGDEF domain-containing protein
VSAKKSIAELVTHDGLHDSLTGLASLPAFLESATRAIALAMREGGSINIFLISISKIYNERGEPIAISNGIDLSSLEEDDLNRLAAQLIYTAGILHREFRESDLLSRYALTEFLLLNKGEYDAINKKLENLGEAGNLAISGTQMNFSDSSNKNRDSQKILLESISLIQMKMIKEN